MRFNIQALAHQVMEQGKPEEVAQYLLSQLPTKTTAQVYNAYKCIRTTIMKQEEYRNPEGFAAMKQLAIDPSISENDRQRLELLLDQPLHRQHWCLRKKNYIESKMARDIKLIKDPFYRFQLPLSIVHEATKARRDDVFLHHGHKKRSTWNRTADEIREMRQAAETFVRRTDLDWAQRSSCLSMLDALCFLTGRRKWELYKTLKVRTVPGRPYQAEIRGLAKIPTTEDVWRKIPLLVPVDVVIQGIVKLRTYHGLKSGSYGGRGLFTGKSMTHTAYRNLFVDQAYAERFTKNQFLIGDEHCGSALLWKSHALAVSFSALTNHYSVMTTDEPNHCLLVDGHQVADPFGGSQERLL